MLSQTSKLPGTSLLVSRLGFGTASIHHLMTQGERQRLLSKAFDSGITHFDTARMYGEGLAERTLGHWLTGGRRQSVTLATKFGMPAQPALERVPLLMYAQRAMTSWARRAGRQVKDERTRCWSVTAAEASLTASLRALKTDWVDLLLVHEPRYYDLEPLRSLASWLKDQQVSGRVRYLGLSGRASTCLAIYQAVPNLFQVLQVEDSLSGREADVLLAAGLPLQITYGYMRLAESPANLSLPLDPVKQLKAGLTRNSTGMVLVSTRRVQRVQILASAGAFN